MVDSAEISLRWTVWPLRERPKAAVGLLISVVALGTLAGMIGGDLFWGLLAGFLVLVWLNAFLLPTRFEADALRVAGAGPLFSRRVLWSDANRLAIQPTGGWIGRAAGPRWSRRGLDLLWPLASEVPDRLMALVRTHHPAIDIRDLRDVGDPVSSGGRAVGGASTSDPVPAARTSQEPAA